MWLEQLIAESTGKEGNRGHSGIGRACRRPAKLRERPAICRIQNKERTGRGPGGQSQILCARPASRLLRFSMRDRLDLGEQFFLWEIATATAGALLRLNPFDQPDVQETKEFTAKILDEVRKARQGA